MTVRQLASGLGLSVKGAHSSIKRGMPTDDMAAALAWRQKNGRGKLTSPTKAIAAAAIVSAITAPAQPPEVIDEMNRRAEEAVEEPTKTFTDTDSCKEALGEQQKLRRHAAAQVARLHHSGDIEASRRWAQTHQQYSAKQLSYEKQWRDLMERDKQTMQVEDAVRTFRAVLQDVRTLAASMPAALAAKVNPTDPHLAQKLLEEWRDKTLFKAIYANN